MSSEKIAIGFDKQFRTSFKINMVCYVLSSMDLYKYLLEIGFIVNEKSPKCDFCSGYLSLVCNNSVNKIIWTLESH
jgi:hypothetical protein